MELRESLSNANQILDEERVSPTVSYDYVPEIIEGGHFSAGQVAMQAVAGLAGIVNISSLRNQRPREIQKPTSYKFKSTNYNLLCALLSRLKDTDRQGFVNIVGLRLSSVPGCVRKNHAVAFPGLGNFSSELPLVTEFLVRNHGKAFLFRALYEAETIPGHALLLRQLEEMIAFSYTIFSDSDYESLTSAMLNLNARTKAKDKQHRRGNNFNVPTTGLWLEIDAASKAIVEQCRKARFLYVKESLSEASNLEINEDKIAVEQYIQQYGFPHTLVESLNQAQRLYRDGTTPFDFKGSMANLRSFLENVTLKLCPACAQNSAVNCRKNGAMA
jgi:hypothetical protein